MYATGSSSMIKLWTTNAERDEYDYKANLFSIIKAASSLERAYASDAINEEDYMKEMYKLISHYKSAKETTRSFIPDIPAFMKEYNLDAYAGYDRLEKGFPSVQQSSNPKVIAETVQLFITMMDSLKLNMVAVDDIHPILKDLVESLHRCHVDSSFDGGPKVEKWLQRLNNRAASDELGEEEIRQFLFDLENSYNSLYRALK